jgi:hypothetical protein
MVELLLKHHADPNGLPPGWMLQSTLGDKGPIGRLALTPAVPMNGSGA